MQLTPTAGLAALAALVSMRSIIIKSLTVLTSQMVLESEEETVLFIITA